MVNRNRRKAKFQALPSLMGETFSSWFFFIIIVKILPDCNPNDEGNSHEFKIRTAFIWKKERWTSVLKWNWQWIYPDFNYVSQTNNLKSKWSSEIAEAQVLTTAFIVGERNSLPEIYIFYYLLPVHHDFNLNDQHNSHKLKIWTTPSKLGQWTSVSIWTWHWIHPDLDYIRQT